MDNGFNQSLAESVCKKIEKLIIDGALAPGDRIRENLLASQLGVSRGPVREACRLLKATGLVTIVPRQGAFVRSLDVGEIINLFEIRSALGRLAGSQAAVSITSEQLSSLESLINLMEETVRLANSIDFTALNIRFHSTLYEATNNSRLADLDRKMGNEIRIYRQKGAAFGGLAVSNQEHREILRCLSRGDAIKAGEQCERHILNGRDRFIRAMTANGILVMSKSSSDFPKNKLREMASENYKC